MPVNSNQKGKRGQREAAKLLRDMGFHDAKSTRQVDGSLTADVVCPETLTWVHVEVKFAYPSNQFSVGSELWRRACSQAVADANGKPWCVLWRCKGDRWWKLTAEYCGLVVTVAEPSIEGVLRGLNAKGGD